jgi:hypothetical protein
MLTSFAAGHSVVITSPYLWSEAALTITIAKLELKIKAMSGEVRSD